MDLNYIRRLAKIFDDSKATQMIIEEEGLKIKFSQNSSNFSKVSEHSQFVPSSYSYPVSKGLTQDSGTYAPVNTAETPAIAEKEQNIEDSPQGNLHILTSPIVGTFYRSPSPDDPAFVEVGSHVAKGQTLCIIEAMKLMNEIECDVNGTISKILIQNATPVEYNQPLFHIIPD